LFIVQCMQFALFRLLLLQNRYHDTPGIAILFHDKYRGINFKYRPMLECIVYRYISWQILLEVNKESLWLVKSIIDIVINNRPLIIVDCSSAKFECKGTFTIMDTNRSMFLGLKSIVLLFWVKLLAMRKQLVGLRCLQKMAMCQTLLLQWVLFSWNLIAYQVMIL